MRLPLTLMLVFLLTACGSESNQTAPTVKSTVVTDWRLVIELPEVDLPVALHLASDGGEAWLTNGTEKVLIPEIDKQGSNWKLHFPSFNNTLLLRQDGVSLEGTLTLVKRGYEQVMQVTGEPYAGYRFRRGPSASSEFTGRWEVNFVEDDGHEYIAIGEFDQQGSKVTGTFLTALGDYRYLAGEVDGDMLHLSTFDGAHAFVFTAKMDSQGQLSGDFWSGTSWHESWTASRNFDAQLPDAYALTYLKDDYERFEFSFPDLDGKPVSLLDEKYRDKVVLVTLSGTWCPNCDDEVRFLSSYFEDNKERGLEVVTLLYEHFEAFEPAAKQGRALRDKYAVGYDILIAGTSDKTQAAETLPMLNHVLAFPTMIFIDRKGQVRKIHTGFSGPGTGQYYTQFVAEFGALMDELLGEPAGLSPTALSLD